MKIIETGITKEEISGANRPALKIGDKLYTVDDRKSTWDKIQEIQSKKELTEKEKTEEIYKLALGENEAKEVLSLDLPVRSSTFLSFCIMSAITGEDATELQKLAKEQAIKNK